MNKTSKTKRSFILATNVIISISLSFSGLINQIIHYGLINTASAQGPSSATPSLTPSPTPPSLTTQLASQIRVAVFDTQELKDIDGLIRGRGRLLDLSRGEMTITENGDAEWGGSQLEYITQLITRPFVVDGISYSIMYISPSRTNDNTMSYVVAMVNISSMELKRVFLVDIHEYEKRVDIIGHGKIIESYDYSDPENTTLIFSSVRPKWVGTRIGNNPLDSTPTSTPLVVPTITSSPSAAPMTATPTRTKTPVNTPTPIATATFWTLLPTKTPIPGTTPCQPYSPDPDAASFVCSIAWGVMCLAGGMGCSSFCARMIDPRAIGACVVICNIFCAAFGWYMCDSDLPPCPTWTPQPTPEPFEACDSLGCTICCLGCLESPPSRDACSMCQWIIKKTPQPNATTCLFCNMATVMAQLTECAKPTSTPTPYIIPTTCPYQPAVCDMCFPKPARWPGGPTVAPGNCLMCLTRCAQEVMSRGCRQDDLECIDSNEFCHATRRLCRVEAKLGTPVPLPTWIPTPLWWPTPTPTP